MPAVPARVTARRLRLPGRFPASRAALLVAGEEGAFALTGGWAGVAAIVGGAPLVRLAADADPFAALDAQPTLEPGSDPGVVVGGGWFGALGFALGGLVEPAVPSPPRRLALPAAPLAFHDHVLVCDRKGSWWFEAFRTPEREGALQERLDELVARLDAAPRPRPVRLRDVRLRAPGAAGHMAAVAECRERIAAGELFQANLALQVDATLDGRPADLAAAAADRLVPAHGAFLTGPWGAVVSASPELFLRREGRTVGTAPIKGTAPADAPAGLAASEKDRAENVMIVDLMRNDLGRVCVFGSVEVVALAEPIPGAGVVHLVSEVKGTLRDDVGDAALVRACFPPGSVTGAPKLQALRVIAELEGAAREAYTGAIGYASPVAGLELSVAIRTFEIVGDEVQLGVGGGITTASEPAAELEECLVKARPLLALGGADAPGALTHAVRAADVVARTRRRGAIPRALAHGRTRPDPSCGVYETWAVRAGVAELLDDHCERLLASAVALGLDPGCDLQSEIGAAASSLGDGRLRVDLDEVGARVTTGPFPTSKGPVRLSPFVLPGGLGAYKWSDRRLVEALAGSMGEVPLFLDADGTVLEAGFASVWIQEGTRLLTPPADGRVLPGVTRAHLLATDTRCHVETIGVRRLEEADALYVSSALRGLVPAVLA